MTKKNPQLEIKNALKAAPGVFVKRNKLYVQFKLPDRIKPKKKSTGLNVSVKNIKKASYILESIKLDITNGFYEHKNDMFWRKNFPLDTTHLQSNIGIEKLFHEYSIAHVNYITSSIKNKLNTCLNWALYYNVGVDDIASITSSQLNQMRQSSVSGSRQELFFARELAFERNFQMDYGENALDFIDNSELEILKKNYFKDHPIVFVGCAKSTIEDYTINLKSVLDFAVEQKYITKNPAQGLKKLAVDNFALHMHDEDVNPFSREELTNLLETIHVPKIRLMVQMLAWTGMRPGELKALAWEDIDLERRQIHLRLNLDRQGALKPVKTRASKRTIDLLPAAVEALNQIKEETFHLPAITETVFFNNKKTIIEKRRRVFLSRENKPYKRPELTTTPKQWANWLIKAGISHRPAYQLRHTYASRMLMQRVPPTWLARQMGHSDTSMIFKIYGKWIADDEPEFMEQLAAGLGQSY